MKKAWWKEAVVYQIYPRSFADSNGDGIGDLKGITEHLDYLQLLGVDAVWLSPVYQSPNDDNGYDISDYRQIMKEFGTMEDFEQMLQEAHRRGIRIVMDLVANHTSDEHAWFVESRSTRDSRYRDYYIWRDGKEGREPNNWGSVFGGSAWEYDWNTGQYYLHCFSKKQPDLNWDNPNVREDIYNMMNWWCEKGIDGFRMDVISMISKSREMPDGPVMDGGYGDFSSYVVCGPHVHEYLKEMNEKVLSRYDLLTVGETGTVPIEEAKQFACSDGSELNMIFQFEHVELTMGKYGKWTTEKPRLIDLKRSLSKWQTGLEGFAWNSLYLDNHDQPRAVSRFGNDSQEYRVISAKMLATMLHMLKGTPYIYQGEELGMTNAHISSLEDYRDIESIGAYHKYVDSGLVERETMMEYLQEISRDNARTPMQWNTSAHAGFTTGTPWIHVNENYRQINAADQIKDPESVFHYYRKLIELRHTYPVIVYGKFEELLPDDPDVFAYRRVLENQSLMVICNYTAAEISCILAEDMQGIELISNYAKHVEGKLQPYEAIVLYQNSAANGRAVLDLFEYNDKKIKVILKDGSTFEGFGSHNPFEYSYCEFGIDAECLQVCDYLIRDSEIERVELIEEVPSIRSTEEEMAMMFSVRISFSEHLKRWEDNELPDKYDYNCFEYSAQPTREEFERALDYQRERGDNFLKLEGDFPLANDFGLSSNVTLTMQLSGSAEDWAVNDNIEIKKPRYKDVMEIERKHFGQVYGIDFAFRNADHIYEYMDFRGAYIGEKLVGVYYYYSSNGYTCVDGLIVDEDYRHRHIATTLLKHAVCEAAGNVVFLHADADGTPKELYEKLGFREVDRRYEYLSTDIGAYKQD